MQKQQLIEWLTVYICGSQKQQKMFNASFYNCMWSLHWVSTGSRYDNWVEPSPFSLHRDQQALESFWMAIQVNHLTMQAAARAREVAAVPMSSQESKNIKSVVWSLKINILLIFIQHNNSSSSLSSGQESAREVRRAREAEKRGPRMGKTNQKMNKKCNHIRPSGLEMFQTETAVQAGRRRKKERYGELSHAV